MRLEPHRLVFLDETGTTTKMARLRGRSLKGRRLRAKSPFGHWKTQTFIAGLRCDALTAPFVIDAPMNRRIFETYVETQLAPTLSKGDVVILDNLPPTKAPPPRRPFAPKAHGCSSCRPIAPTSIRSRWLSQSSSTFARQRHQDHRCPLAGHRRYDRTRNAHYLYHRDLIGDSVADSPAYRAPDDKIYLETPLKRIHETQANQFAANVLMPRDLIATIEARYPGIELPETARRLGVSLPALRVRKGLPPYPDATQDFDVVEL